MGGPCFQAKWAISADAMGDWFVTCRTGGVRANRSRDPGARADRADASGTSWDRAAVHSRSTAVFTAACSHTADRRFLSHSPLQEITLLHSFTPSLLHFSSSLVHIQLFYDYSTTFALIHIFLQVSLFPQTSDPFYLLPLSLSNSNVDFILLNEPKCSFSLLIHFCIT